MSASLLGSATVADFRCSIFYNDCFLPWRSHGTSRSLTLFMELSSLGSTFTLTALYDDSIFCTTWTGWFYRSRLIDVLNTIFHFSCVQTPLNRLRVGWVFSKNAEHLRRRKGLEGLRAQVKVVTEVSPFKSTGNSRFFCGGVIELWVSRPSVFGTIHKRAQGHPCYV